MATTSENVIGIRIQASGAADLAAKFQKAGAALKKFHEETAMASSVFTKFAAVAAAALSVQALMSFVRASQEAAVATAQLGQALRVSGQDTEANTTALTQQANALQDLTGISDESVQASQRLQIQFGLTAAEVLKLTPLIADLAASTGDDLAGAGANLGTVTSQVVRALDGETITIGKLNIKARDLDDLMRQLKDRFGGQ